MNDKYESEIARLELANSGLRSINAGICVELAAAKAEVTRLTEKYDFQRLVKSEESLKAEVERLTEHNCVGEKSFTEYWCSGLGPLSARKVWPQKSDELKHLHTWLTAWSFSNADRDRYKALCQKMAEASEQMLGGHFNLYKSVFGENSEPEHDIVRKELKYVLAEYEYEMGEE